MAAIWVITADSEYARFLEADRSSGPLKELKTMVCASARQHEQDLVSDRPGRSKGSAGGGRHTMDPSDNAKHVQAEKFAREIAHAIDEGLDGQAFSKLVLVAPPAFLGLLRSAISNRAKKAVSCELDKNIVRSELDEIREHLPERL